MSDEDGTTLSKGIVKHFDPKKGYGFITVADDDWVEKEDEVFFHQTAINMSGFRTLVQGQWVEMEYKLLDRGLKATKVTPDEKWKREHPEKFNNQFDNRGGYGGKRGDDYGYDRGGGRGYGGHYNQYGGGGYHDQGYHDNRGGYGDRSYGNAGYGHY